MIRFMEESIRTPATATSTFSNAIEPQWASISSSASQKRGEEKNKIPLAIHVRRE